MSWHRRLSYWPYPPLHAVLPRGLPVGALTVIKLGDLETPGDWSTAVGWLVDHSVRSRRPTVYVEVGGMCEYAGDMALAQRLPLPHLATDPDEDMVVCAPRVRLPARDLADVLTARTGPLRAASYDCHVPTLLNVAPVLAEQERRFGPALVVLNNIESARPYRLPVEDGEPLAGRLTVAQRSAWLTGDLLQYAEKRTHAPTVVTCEVPGQGLDLDLLTAVALLEVTCTVRSTGRVSLRWRHRRDLADAWGPQGVHDVPAWLL